MKKFFLITVMAIVAMTAFAQIENGFRYGITSTGSMSKYSEIPNTKNIFGYGGGLIVEYNFSPNLYLGTELQFGLRGTKFEALDGSLKSFNFVLPVNIGGRINVSDTFSVFGQAGPYVSFAVKKAEMIILGKETISGESFDWGFNTKAGVEFSQIQVFGGYEIGMKEVWSNEAKNRSIIFGLAYMF